MKIAFVGKGGSGKSTLSSLFILHSIALGKKVIALDADLNMHLDDILGVSFPENKKLSRPELVNIIHTYLKGNNHRIIHSDQFLKSTPPGSGSNLIIARADDQIIERYSVPFSGGQGRLLVVGSYESETIGTSCYHTNLAIAENLLLHMMVPANTVVVTDMAAGTDAFSGTLHAQFDLLVLVVEPSIEGVEVFRQYFALAQSAGIAHQLVVVGNKIEDDEDVKYLKEHVGRHYIGGLPMLKQVRRARQQGALLSSADVPQNELFAVIDACLNKAAVDPNKRLSYIWKLHRRHVKEPYIVSLFGEGLDKQIDENFRYPEMLLQ